MFDLKTEMYLLFIRTTNKYALSTYCVPGTVLKRGVVVKTDPSVTAL